MARHDKISPDGDARIKELLLSGYTQSLVARMTGVDPKSVATRRAELKRSGAVFPECACGRSVSHTGTCAHRVKRQREQPDVTFERGRVTRVTQYDSIAWDSHHRRIGKLDVPQSNCSPIEMVDFVNQVVPKSFNPHIRDDLCQDILVAIVAGELKLENIGGALQKFTRDLYRLFPTLEAPKSLDQRLYSGDEAGEVTRAEFVADDSPLADAVMIEAEEEPDEFLEYISNLHAIEIGGRGIGQFNRRPSQTERARA